MRFEALRFSNERSVWVAYLVCIPLWHCERRRERGNPTKGHREGIARGDLMRLLHSVRNDTARANLFMVFTIMYPLGGALTWMIDVCSSLSRVQKKEK